MKKLLYISKTIDKINSRLKYCQNRYLVTNDDKYLESILNYKQLKNELIDEKQYILSNYQDYVNNSN